MKANGIAMLATNWHQQSYWSNANTNLFNCSPLKVLSKITLDVAFPIFAFEPANSGSKLEEVMVTERSLSADPRANAKLFAECIQKIASNRDGDAFDTLFRYYAPRVKSYCLRLGADASSAEEVTQEAMVLVWRNADQYKSSLASASTWIFTIARNLSIDRFRKSRRPQFDPNDPLFVPDGEQTPDTLIERIQTEENVRKIMDTLSSNERNVLMLSFYENLSHGEISKQLNIPVGTVKSRIRLAFAKIRAKLDAQDGAVT